MLTGGASVLSWLATRRRIDGTDRKDGAWFNALEARMRVHADIVNIGLHFFHKDVRPYAAPCNEA